MNLSDEAVAALARAIRIDTQEITRRKAFFEFDETDASLLTELHARLQDVLRRFIPDAPSLERLNQTQATYFDSLTTYRESLRDIEVCLSAQAAKLYHMGFPHEIKRSTLADANETRDWRIYAEFAQRLIVQARKLYAGDSFGIECRTLPTRWTRRLSICACRCFHGRCFARPSRL